MTFTEKEKRLLSIIDSNLDFFNTGRRIKLTIKLYVSDGNRIDVLWNKSTVAASLTIDQAYCFIWGFTSRRARK